ncbi:MAG: HNH endonuclease [Thermoguttaceae bacterium]
MTKPISKGQMANAIEELLHEGLFDRGGVEIWVRGNFRCEYCKTDLLNSVSEFDTGVGDHILPQSKYPNLINDINNYANACHSCNKLKRNWDPVDQDQSYKTLERLSDQQRLDLIEKCKESKKKMN